MNSKKNKTQNVWDKNWKLENLFEQTPPLSSVRTFTSRLKKNQNKTKQNNNKKKQKRLLSGNYRSSQKKDT